MAFKVTHARRNPATPGWAWAVAGLCGLLLIPVALENHRLVHVATPLRLAGPPIHPTPLALAGHSRSAGSPGHSRAGARAPLGAVRASALGLDNGSDASVAWSGAGGGLDLQIPGGVLGTENGATPSVGPALVTTGASFIRLRPDTGDSVDLPWTGRRLSGDALGTSRTTPKSTVAGSTVLIRPRPVTPQPRFWWRLHGHLGPASRVRRRHNARFYGYFVSA
jgi:hypothetical protein